MAQKMLIDATHPEETRVVVVDGQKVDDFDFESITKRQLAGNIYLAKVTRVEPSLQAAFVEYGGNRHGFLAFSEVHPDYYQIPIADREALLAEDAREEEERRAREEASEEGNSGKPARASRGRGRRKKEAAPATDAAAAVAGLEVIDVVTDDPSDAQAVDSAPAGMTIAEPDAGEDAAASASGAGETPVETNAAEPEEVIAAPEDTAAPSEVEAAPDTTEEPAAETEATQDADPATDSNETGNTAEESNAPPKSIAESAGLDDEDRVSETVSEAAEATSNDAAGRVTEEVAETQSEPVSEEAAPADAAPAEAAPEMDAADATPTAPEAEVAPADDAAAASEPDQAEGSAPDDSEAKPEKRPRRRRRARKSDDKPGDAKSEPKKTVAKKGDSKDASDDAGDDDGSPAAEVESVGAEDTFEEAANARTRLRRKYKIQDVIKVRQILLVQVVKEERGNKGAALTTYLSLAGRYCVLMPNTARGGGISRKITNASDRKRLREITGGLDVPQGMGLIVRTAGAERTKPEIKRDYEFLIRQWEQIRETTLGSIAPTLIYEEGSLIKRSIRDVYSKDIEQILVEGEVGYREAKEYMKMLMPSHAKNVQPYTDPIPLFSRFQVETYLNGMFNPTVQLKSGGYIVIGVTEALVAVDVNSGRATKQGSIEETALQTNLEAADEVARQLRLRDLAGLIVIDFIDMDENRNNRAVEKRMKDRLKSDRARIQVGRISAFGLMEMSRQRLRPGMLEATTQPCPHCLGVGLIRSDENLSLSILREVEEEGLRNRTDQVTVRAPIDVANYLINHKRPHITAIEERHSITVIVLADPALHSPNYVVERSKSPARKPARETAAVTAETVVTEEDMIEDAEVLDNTSDAGSDDGGSKSRRRRGKRGGRRKRNGESTDERPAEAGEEQSSEAVEAGAEDDEKPKSRRSRGRRRGGRGRQNAEGEASTEAQAETETGTVAETATGADGAEAQIAEPSEAPADHAPVEAPAEAAEVTEPDAAAPEEVADDPAPAPEVLDEPQPAPAPAEALVAAEAAPQADPEEPAKPKRRGWWSFGS